MAKSRTLSMLVLCTFMVLGLVPSACAQWLFVGRRDKQIVFSGALSAKDHIVFGGSLCLPSSDQLGQKAMSDYSDADLKALAEESKTWGRTLNPPFSGLLLGGRRAIARSPRVNSTWYGPQGIGALITRDMNFRFTHTTVPVLDPKTGRPNYECELELDGAPIRTTYVMNRGFVAAISPDAFEPGMHDLAVKVRWPKVKELSQWMILEIIPGPTFVKNEDQTEYHGILDVCFKAPPKGLITDGIKDHHALWTWLCQQAGDEVAGDEKHTMGGFIDLIEDPYVAPPVKGSGEGQKDGGDQGQPTLDYDDPTDLLHQPIQVTTGSMQIDGKDMSGWVVQANLPCTVVAIYPSDGGQPHSDNLIPDPAGKATDTSACFYFNTDKDLTYKVTFCTPNLKKKHVWIYKCDGTFLRSEQ